MILNLEKLIQAGEAEYNKYIQNQQHVLSAETILLIRTYLWSATPDVDIGDLHQIFEMGRRLTRLEDVPTHASQATFPTTKDENIGTIVYSEQDAKFYISKGFEWIELTHDN